MENAIKHGLEPKPEGGRIEIGAEVIDGQLAVHVLDTGVGFMPKGEGGVGLANVRERLKALYNGRAELIIAVPPDGRHLRHDQSALRNRPCSQPDWTTQHATLARPHRRRRRR